MSLLDADRRIIEVCGLVRQPIVNNPSGCQQADAAKQGRARLVILPIVSFICAKNIVGMGVAPWLAKCYLSSRLSADL